MHKTSSAPKTTAQRWAEVYPESFEGCRGLGLLRFERKKWLGPGGIANERALEIIRTRNLGLHRHETPNRTTEDPLLLKLIDVR